MTNSGAPIITFYPGSITTGTGSRLPACRASVMINHDKLLAVPGIIQKYNKVLPEDIKKEKNQF